VLRLIIEIGEGLRGDLQYGVVCEGCLEVVQ